MSHLIPCTVQVVCRNNIANMRHCLETLKDFDEVIVQDGYSTDGTREAAMEFPNVRVMDQNRTYLDADGRITDFAAMRNESIAAAKYDWILVVDADEGIREDLAEEVRAIVERSTPGVYQAFRRFYVGGERIDRCAGYPAYQIRLFHRTLTEGYVKRVHERLHLRPGVQVQTLKTELPVPFPPAKTLDAKYRRYLAMEVQRLGALSWARWFSLVLRNLRSALGLSLLVAGTWIMPGHGKRMPFAYDWQAIRQSLLTIWYTCPLVYTPKHS